jgi:hypothetical protein
MKTQKRKPTIIEVFFALTLGILMFTLFYFCLPEANAQTPQKSEWVEQTTVEIPYSVEINKGTTKNGNPKYWIDIENMSIAVSAGNYEKFIKKEIVLVLVEWYNPTTGKYKYTTRQKAKSNVVKKLNLDELW